MLISNYYLLVMSCSYTAWFLTFLGGGGGWDMDPLKNLVKGADPFSEKCVQMHDVQIVKFIEVKKRF